ncbi:hypothetical protein UNSWCD_1492 [Campylobacter concisus UNSWCD]|nr:hypothetical protein UNSWCD_1492 [Campylobacter concisus UNSWCD]
MQNGSFYPKNRKILKFIHSALNIKRAKCISSCVCFCIKFCFYLCKFAKATSKTNPTRNHLI